MSWKDYLTGKRWDKEALIADIIREAMDESIAAVTRKYASLKTVDSLNAIKLKLQEEIETMKIEKAGMVEQHQREKREIEHKVGLHKMRQVQEIELAKREATVKAEEGNLEQKEEAFTERMEFFKEQLDTQVDYLQDMMKDILKRLPSAEIIARIGGIEAKSKEE